ITMTSAQFVLYLTCLFLGRMGQVTNQKFSVHQDTRFVSANVGESLTLRCFYEGDDVTRLYWYKQILGQKPRLISTLYVFNRKGSFHDEFKNNPRFTLDTGKSKNNLKITDLHISDSATYYCATRLSLIIEFAEGTIVNMDSLVLVYVLSGALTVTTILVILLALLIYKMNKTHSLKSGTESQARSLFPSTAEAEGYQDAHNLHYAALSIDLPNRSRRQRNNTKDECVYSSVRQ
uniref:Ig-like domain-containing protein n=1 Tax=Lates calcarifer TaxID=8187 RepID=A0A4W6BMT5_LATCA